MSAQVKRTAEAAQALREQQMQLTQWQLRVAETSQRMADALSQPDTLNLTKIAQVGAFTLDLTSLVLAQQAVIESQFNLLVDAIKALAETKG